jgi:Ala-tRNA(Pro) deacylase
MTLTDYLDAQKCAYKMTQHEPVFTAEALATAECVPERQVAKPVVVCADKRFYVCVLPADRKIDLHALQKHLNVTDVRLADEEEMERLFADSEIGAEPPLGNLYNLPTLMDKKLLKDKEIVFQAGNHHEAVWMSTKEYQKLVNPAIGSFSYPAAFDEIESMPFDPFYFDPYGL